MELLQRAVWGVGIILLLGGLYFLAMFGRNAITEKNYSDFWLQKSIDGGEYVYVAMGDSIALGSGASDPTKSYVGLIADRIQNTTGKTVKVVNISTPNAKLEEVIENQLPRLSSFSPDLVTVDVGSDDVGEDSAQVEQSLSELLSKLPENISYIAEVPAVYDTKKDVYVNAFNNDLKVVAGQTGVTVVPIFRESFTKIQQFTYYDWDFSHPNDSGHQLWADSFWNALQQ